MQHRVMIEYCTSWGYQKKATGAAANLLGSYEDYLSELTLKPSDGGRFEVSVDGKTIFSKLEMNRFPGDEELKTLVGEVINR